MAPTEFDAFWAKSSLTFNHLTVEEQAAELAHHHDLISFLALMQHCELDLLPIKWQPALQSLGTGGTAQVDQGLIHAQMSYAFKRVKWDHGLGNEGDDVIRKWAMETLILCHPKVRGHAKIAQLEACCLEILEDGRLSPVLISEKAQLGDLEHFIALEPARSVPFKGWVSICLDIGLAIKTMHSCNIIHADVKPSNILMYCGFESNYFVKLADFGYTSIGSKEDSLVWLAVSRPWTAPDHHHRRFRVVDAKKMDAYSYGLVCFWLLIGNLRNSNSTADEDLWNDLRRLERIKNEGFLLCFAQQTLEKISFLKEKQKQNLLKFFALLLSEKHEDRTADWDILLPLLKEDFITDNSAQYTPASVADSKADISSAKQEQFTVPHPQFRIKEYVNSLAFADPRIRTGLARELDIALKEGKCEHCSRNTAFQLALCAYIRFGSYFKKEDHKILLERSGFSQDTFSHELELLRNVSNTTYRQKTINDINDEFLYPVDLSHECRDMSDTEFGIFKDTLLEEAQSSEEFFGQTNAITIALKRTLASLLNGRNMFKEASLIQNDLLKVLKDDPVILKVLMDLSITYSLQGFLSEAEIIRSMVVKMFKETLGVEHAGTLSAMTNLASIRNDLGRANEAEALLLEVIDAKTRKFGEEHGRTLDAKSHLAVVYYKQERYDEAEKLQKKIVESRVRTLGNCHAFTWTSRLNFAAIIAMQGRLTEAGDIELQVVELRKKHLGTRHHLTLTALSNLASTYRVQQRWVDEEAILQELVTGRWHTLGDKHPDTLKSTKALANNYIQQKRYENAEQLLKKLIEIQTELEDMGPAHPSTLASRASLAWVLFDKGSKEEAEEMQLRSIEEGKKKHGEFHDAVIESLRQLAMMYKCWGRLEEAKERHIKVWEMRKSTLGSDHPNTNRSAEQIRQVEIIIQQEENLQKG